MLENSSQGLQSVKQWQPGYYVLFLDPESFMYYRKDLRRDDYIVYEPFADEEMKKKFFMDN